MATAELHVLGASPRTGNNAPCSNYPGHLGTGPATTLFAGLTEQQCAHIYSMGRIRRFDREQVLFSQGEAASRLIMVASGTVKLVQVSSEGEEVLLWMGGPGDAFGLCPNPCQSHSCSAIAKEPCRTIEWDHEQLKSIVERYPAIAGNLFVCMGKRLEEMEERFREVATERVARRLALAILRLVKTVGKPSEGGISIALSREELAQMTGTTLFTVSRIITEWAANGYVIPKRNSVIICNPEKLEQESLLAQ